jgi:hypothetical protein
MNTVRLEVDGSLFFEGQVIMDNILSHLGDRVALADGCTLRSYFRMLESHSTLARINRFLPAHLEQFRGCPQTGCTAAGYDHLLFAKTVEMIGFPGNPRLEIYTSLRGRSGGEELEIRSSRLNGMLDLPLQLGRLKHIVFGDRMDVFEYDTVFTLFEFVDGIAWELSFHGTPEACEL